MKSLGFTVATSEGHFLSRYGIKKESDGLVLDAGFEKGILNSVSAKKLVDAAETKKTLQSYHPDIKFWVVQFFKDKGQFYFKSATGENPPWFQTQHDRFSGLYQEPQ